MVPQRVEAVGSGVDGLMQSSKGEVRRALWEMSSSERRRWPHARFQESNTEKAPEHRRASLLNNEQLHCNCTATGFVGGSNRCILRVDRDCVARIHRGRKKREERIDKMADSSIHCIFTVSRGQKEQRRERR